MEDNVMRSNIKKQWGKMLLDTLKKSLKDISWREILNLFLWSMVVNLIIETLGRIKYSNLLGGLLSVFQMPYVFFYNVLIIMVTISFAFLFKRRYFMMSLLSVIWIGFGISNYILLSYRVTPFSAVELKLIDAALGVMKSYVSGGTLAVVILISFLVVGMIVLIWKKGAVRQSVNYISSLITIAVLALLLNAATSFGINLGFLQTQFPNLADAYVDYGFVYCFSNSLVNTGIQKPKGYSKRVEGIQAAVDERLGGDGALVYTESPEEEADEEKNNPNIIFLQLESFFDITAIDNLELSEDPIPNYRQCVADYSSGFLSVPSVGAGTANTEFEVLTGMNLDFFGPGEYPYKTVLKNSTCETICYNLKNYGYKTQAMHNNRATFYGRNEVFCQLGFDIFTSVELMNVQEYTQNGWVKDSVLTGEMVKALRATEERDFIFTISVQGHGNYPKEPSLEEEKIKVIGGIEDEGNKNAVQYYVNQLYEMDLFLGDLIRELNELGEETVLVAYGDHLPNLGFKEEDLTVGNMYQTQYFAWNNCGLEVKKEDIEAYQLTARVLESINVADGVINAFHQTNKEIKDTQEYQDDLKVLGYDLFYGNHISTGGTNIYLPTTIQYGVENVAIADVYRDQSDTEYLIIRGNNFTKYSRVYINDEVVESEKMDENTLRVHRDKVQETVQIVVKQSYRGKLTLQTSNPFEYMDEGDSDFLDGDEIKQESENGQTNPQVSEAVDWGSLIDEEAAQ